jgi:sterol desaturase/sphingolipid hydroxylase (fatty acid hydroxylase superfamily)
MQYVPEWLAYSDWLSNHSFVLIAGIFIVSVISERAYYAIYRPGEYPDLDSLSSIGTGLLGRAMQVVIDFFLLFTIYLWVFENFRIFDLSYSIWGFVVGLLIHDFAWYWQHRIRHRVGFLWADHQVHHSSNTYTFPVAQRACFSARLLRSPAFALAALVGVDPSQFLVVAIVAQTWGIFTHSNTVGKLGWLEGILVTPSMHRVHHGTQPQYIDKNYGEFFAIWDRAFGTYQEENETVKFGLVTPITTLNPIKIQFAGYGWLWKRLRSSSNWLDKINYLWRPPEWQHSTKQSSHFEPALDQLSSTEKI